jgi:L-lysine 6-transaminase
MQNAPNTSHPKSPFPGPLSAAMIAELQSYVLADVYPFVVNPEKCSGMWLETVDGQRLFDWAGYYASKLIGHNHPGLQEPEYVKQLVLAANNKVANPDFLTPQCLEYYRTIHRLAPRCMRNPQLEVYAVNSGAEAIENMMKYFINLHHQRKGGRRKEGERLRFMYFEKAFHGRTVFALNVTQTGDPVATKDFHGIILGNIQLPFPELNNSAPAAENDQRTHDALAVVDALLSQYKGEVVGIIVEPIQGAGGHRMAQAEFFRGLSELAHRHEVFLGFDEVQTAGGPTGELFMVDQLDLPHPPHAVATAKKFGNGVVYMLHPMDDRGVLDSTWGGSLADMVRFVQEMKIVEREDLIARARTNGALLSEGLRALERAFPHLLANVRGLGLYQGFTLPSAECRDQLAELALNREHLLLLPAGASSIRTRPNLSVTAEEVGLFLNMLRRCLEMLDT